MDIPMWVAGWLKQSNYTIRNLALYQYTDGVVYENHYIQFITEIRDNSEADLIFAIVPDGVTINRDDPSDTFLYFRISIGYTDNWGFEKIGYISQDVQPIRARRKTITYWEV